MMGQHPKGLVNSQDDVKALRLLSINAPILKIFVPDCKKCKYGRWLRVARAYQKTGLIAVDFTDGETVTFRPHSKVTVRIYRKKSSGVKHQDGRE